MRILTALVVLLELMAGRPVAAQPHSLWQCFPTCSQRDGRMLSLAGAGLFTLGGDSIDIQLISSQAELRLGIFDGDTGAGNPSHWDRVPPDELGVTQLRYRLLADPAGDGTSVWEVGPRGGWWSNRDNPSRGVLYSTYVAGQEQGRMPDNGWFEIQVQGASGALAQPGSECPRGHYCYRLRVTLSHPASSTESNFKLRSSADIELQPQAFSVVGALRNPADAGIIYPGYDQGDLSQTTYDGSWELRFDLPRAASSLAIWDGDFDYGSWDCSLRDEDDLDTCQGEAGICLPNSWPDFRGHLVPPWAVGTAARAQGVAVGEGGGGGCQPTGAPPDDRDPDSLIPLVPPCAVSEQGLVHCFATRFPSVRYHLETPRGWVSNLNPSGNQEWEQFLVTTDPGQTADAFVDTLPAGAYRLVIEGLDPANLSALRFPAPVSGVPGPPQDPRSPGYWKNHLERWPLRSLQLGGIQYSKAQARRFMASAGRGDKTYTLFRHLAAAKLNAASGNAWTCIGEVMAQADRWLHQHPVGSQVRARSRVWKVGERLKDRLEAYNHGRLACVWSF